jgi:hypothetical protein
MIISSWLLRQYKRKLERKLERKLRRKLRRQFKRKLKEKLPEKAKNLPVWKHKTQYTFDIFSR